MRPIAERKHRLRICRGDKRPRRGPPINRSRALRRFGVTAAALVVAAALLATVPLTGSIAELTDDPGIDVAVQAGVAQAGTVTFLGAAVCLAVTSVLLARVGATDGAVPRWIRITSWVVAATLWFRVTVAFLIPFAAWAVAVGLVWSANPCSQPDPSGR
jgi:hypothetical protein